MLMHKWRIIKTQTHDAALNMALDEVCLNGIAQKTSPPTIRFYRWLPSAISIGYFQSLQREVDENKCLQLTVDVVRRLTGGGAVYHDYEGELTYSVLSPLEFFPKNIIESYQEICGRIISALKNLGLNAEFVPINDIICSGKKISGNAQTRKKGVLLQHGTILYKVNLAKMFSLLKIPDEKIRDKMISVASERVTSISALNSRITFQQLEIAVFSEFIKGKEHEFGDWTTDELTAAKILAATKYQQDHWNKQK